MEFGEALAHAGEAVAAGSGLRAQAAAVVAHLDLDLRLPVAIDAFTAQADADLDRARMGVAGDVGQALLQHAQQGEADAVVEWLVASVAQGLDRAAQLDAFVMAGPQRAVGLQGVLDALVRGRRVAAQALQDRVHAVLHVAGHGEDGLRAAVDAGLFGAALQDGAGDRAHGGDALAELVVQLARDRAPLLLEPGLDRAREVLIRFQAGVGRARLVETVGEAVVAARQQRELARGVLRQALVEAPAGAMFERGVDLLQRRERAPDRQAGGEPQREQQRARPAERGDEVVPGVEHRTRGVGRQYDFQGAGVEPARAEFGRDLRREPGRCIAARLVGRLGRNVEPLPARSEDLEPVGADAPDRGEATQQALARLGLGPTLAPLRKHDDEPLLRDPGRGLDLLVDGLARLAHPHCRADPHQHRDQHGEHQAQAGLQAGRARAIHDACRRRLACAEKPPPRRSRSTKGWRRPSAA